MEDKLMKPQVQELDEIEIIELDERLDLAADPLVWVAGININFVSCHGCNCSA